MSATLERRRVPRVLGVFGERRTWCELFYAFVGLPQGIAFFVFAWVTLSLGLSLAVLVVGLPLVAASGLVCRMVGDAVRRGGNLVLGTTIPPAPPFVREPGALGWLVSCLRDGTAWRARLYLLLKLPLGIVSFVTVAVFWIGGAGALTHAFWRRYLPCQTDGSVCHRGAAFGPHYYVDTPARIVGFCAVGVLLLLAAPWATKAIVHVDRAVARTLLGPTPAQRVQQLEASRAEVVDDAATTLRRIERDLHDGTQARLVALAMNVGLAREKLAEGADPAEAARLLDAAHASAKEAITEVRDLARGIHPAVLDTGLETALATLAARSAVPVHVVGRPSQRPDPAIETIAYFCVAELVTNVAKHSGATGATVELAGTDRLLLSVRDDGRGGATVEPGSGLAGLQDRVGSVDGTMRVTSPAGGPTVVTIDLPMVLSR